MSYSAPARHSQLCDIQRAEERRRTARNIANHAPMRMLHFFVLDSASGSSACFAAPAVSTSVSGDASPGFCALKVVGEVYDVWPAGVGRSLSRSEGIWGEAISGGPGGFGLAGRVLREADEG